MWQLMSVYENVALLLFADIYTYTYRAASKDAELEATYLKLLKETSPHEKAIMRDLGRTFPNHSFFTDSEGIGQENLFNVLKAYSLCVFEPEMYHRSFMFSEQVRRTGWILSRITFRGGNLALECKVQHGRVMLTD